MFLWAVCSGSLLIFTALICFVFYIIYISAGLVGLGLLVESLFPISYEWAVASSILIAVPYDRISLGCNSCWSGEPCFF